jgi:hypothetical protein
MKQSLFIYSLDPWKNSLILGNEGKLLLAWIFSHLTQVSTSLNGNSRKG